MCIVTFARPDPSSSGSTFTTLPTSTPAIRTGERLARRLELSNSALSS